MFRGILINAVDLCFFSFRRAARDSSTKGEERKKGRESKRRRRRRRKCEKPRLFVEGSGEEELGGGRGGEFVGPLPANIGERR